MPDMSQLNIPPAALQALQQQQGSGMDITSILAQLSQMSPEEVSAALAQLGINVPPEQLAKAAEDWVDNSAANASGDSSSSADVGEQSATAAEGESDSAQPSQPAAQSAPSAPTGEDEEAEAEPEEQVAPPPTGGSRGGVAMPKGGGAGGGMGSGGDMDALISAAMSQGDPNAVPPMRGPTAPGPRAPSVAMPGSGAGAQSPAAGDDPRMKAMIQNVYRQAGDVGKTGVPQGPRGIQTGSRGGSAPNQAYPRGGRKR